MSEFVTVSAAGKATVHLHPGQLRAWRSKRRFVFIIASTQGGKTCFVPWWLAREIKQKGPGDYLAVTATYDLFKLKLLPEMLRVFQGYEYAKAERVLTAGDTRIILRSADAEGGLESATAKAAVLDECGQDRFTLSAWEGIQRRLSLSGGRVLGATTPYNLGWLKSQVYDRWKAGDTDYDVIQFNSLANPAFPRAEYERAKRTLPDWKFRMFYEGQFTRPEGLIYGDYIDDHVGHLVRPFEIPKEWPRYVGIDFGAVHTALIWLAVDMGKAAWYVYRESLEGGKTTGEHVAQALRMARAERVIGWFGGSNSETQQRMDWNAAGLPVMPPGVIDVESGIDRVIALLKARQLLVFDTCAGLRDELGTYSREMDQAGQMTEAIKDKQTFHRLDALRYVVCGMTYRPPQGQRVVYTERATISPF